jgi:hypothetical protein
LPLQSYNRYSYVLNNSSSLVDPTGFSWLSSLFHAIGHFLSRYWRPIVANIAVAITYGQIVDWIGAANLAAVQWGACQMRQYVVEDSLKNQYGLNASGDSDGWNGDGFKTGGARAAFGDTSIEQVDVAPFGGAQGGHGYLFGIAYSLGSWQDSLVEAFGGPHDWLSSIAYTDAGNIAEWARFGFGQMIFNVYSGIALFPAAAIVGASTAPEIVITNGK